MTERVRRVLLVGNGEFYHIGAFFRRALENLGYECCFIDEVDYFKALERSLLQKVVSRLIGRRPLTYWSFNRALLEAAASFRPHVVLVTKGSYVRPEVLAQIKSESQTFLVNYATDNPFNPASSTRDVVAAIPLYDLYVTTKRAIIPDLRRAGARYVVWIPFGYEPTIHFLELPKSPEEAERWASDVVFIGGCDRDRAPFFTTLTKLSDVRVCLYGGYWDRYPELRRFWHGFALGRDYRLALGGSKIAPCLVRRDNRDGHVMRTFEIPACGAFLLAERTEEHLELFQEGKEIACFSSPEELADKVRYYLSHDEERQRIAEAGYKKVTRGQHTYQDRLEQILQAVDAA